MALQDTITSLIDKFGQTVTIRRLSGVRSDAVGESYNADTSYSDRTVTAYLADYQGFEIDGERIRTGDQRAYISAQVLPEPPEAGDYVIVGGEEWKVVRDGRTRLRGATLLYDLQLTRS